MFIQKLYEFITWLKNQGQARYFPPEEVIDALNRAVLDKYKTDWRFYEQKNELTDTLGVFMRFPTLTKQGDYFVLPEDYRHTINHEAINPTDSEKTFKLLEKTTGEWVDVKLSKLLPADYEVGYFRRYKVDSEWRVDVLPSDVEQIIYYYLKEPVQAVYAYDIVNGRPEYKEQGSVDVEMPTFVHNDLIVQTLKYLGIVLGDGDLMSFEQVQVKQPT